MDAVVVDALGPVAGAAVAWRAEGALRVTVAVSVSFEIVPGGVMKVTPPLPLSLPGDLAPYRPRADVLLAGRPAAGPDTPVHLRVGREHTLLDEVIAHAPAAFPAPGGAPAAGPAHLAPPILTYPPGFDWSTLQAAPPGGRTGHLHGDEWIAIDGVRAGCVQSRLPGAHALAAVYGHPAMAAGSPVPLVADTLRIDTDRMRAVVVWRGSFFVPTEEALASIRVMVGLDDARPAAGRGEETVTLATSTAEAGEIELSGSDIEVVGPAQAPPPEPAPPGSSRERTANLAEDEQQQARSRPAVPFTRRPSEPPPSSWAGSPHSSYPGQVAPPRPATGAPPPGGTAVLDEVAQAFQRDRPAVPFHPPAPAAPGPSVAAVPAAAAPEPISPFAPAAHTAPLPPAAALASAPAVAPDGLELDNDTGLALGVIPWGLSPPRDCLAVIVKATCDLAPGRPAEPGRPAAPLTGEVYAEDTDGRYLAHPSDLVPFKVRADVVVIGHAVAPRGRATEMDVELQLGHAESRVHRVIHVSGDRTWIEGHGGLVPSAPEPFERIPIRHERAFGGAGSDENPAGVGMLPRGYRPRGPLRLPNLEDPHDRVRIPGRHPAPACFAPLPLAWRERSVRPDRRRAPWPFFPEDLDWARFQAAPPSQRLPFLAGDEPFSLSGMHAGPSPLEGSLPGLQPRCSALRDGKREAGEVALRLDTVVLDVGSMTVHLVWRGALPVGDERQPDVRKVTLRLPA